MRLDAEEPMPAVLGWHPWFLRHAAPSMDGEAGLELEFDAQTMYERDGDGIPTGALVAPKPRPWDDCFTGLRRPPVLRWPGFLELEISSTCPDWVVYDERDDAICVEPQTGPPDALNLRPTVVRPGRPRRAP
jgi:aldose 1-epimerase